MGSIGITPGSGSVTGGTMITGPGNPGMSQIDQAFGNIYSMFGGKSNLSGGGSGPFGTSPQPVSGADNSLTAQQRGTGNLAGQIAPTAFNLGTGLIGTGTGVAQGGLDVMGTGLSTLQPSIDFYNKLISGDPATMTAALAPTAANLSKIATGAETTLGQGSPMGAYRSLAMANQPFAQTAQIGTAAEQLQPAAAAALGQLGAEQATIGQGMAGVGTALSGQGTTMTGQGLQGLMALYNALINKQQVNQQSTPLTAFDQFASGVANLAGAAGGAMTGVGNMTGANAPKTYNYF